MPSIPYQLKPIKATCDLFGSRSLMIEFRENHRIPNRWIRFWSKVFFNSKWTIVKETNNADS